MKTHTRTQPIYLDYNATTPHHPEVIEVMRPFLETQFGNPSSTHWYGIETRKAVQNARKQTASLLNCDPDHIIFTSGGTEANNHAIQATASANRTKRNHIITSRIEHPAVLEVCRYLEGRRCHITYLPVDGTGIVNPADVEHAITSQTLLITIMHANNETGSVQPIRDIVRIAKNHGIMVHTDAAQSVGKIPTDVTQLGVDMLSLAGHKMYAPKGVGALYVGPSVKIDKLMHGAGQEKNHRAGTENLLGIVGLGKACEIAQRDLEKNRAHMTCMRDLLYAGLQFGVEDIRRNGHEKCVLPNTLNLSFAGIEANRILEEIGLEVAASAGAACHSHHVEISHVLQAMEVPLDWAKGTLRFSTGRQTDPADIHRAVQVITSAVKKLRSR